MTSKMIFMPSMSNTYSLAFSTDSADKYDHLMITLRCSKHISEPVTKKQKYILYEDKSVEIIYIQLDWVSRRHTRKLNLPTSQKKQKVLGEENPDILGLHIFVWSSFDLFSK